MKRTWLVLFTLCLLNLAGCAAPRYTMVETDALPLENLNWPIDQSPVYGELIRFCLEPGPSCERTKIKYLLTHTRLSPFEFDRNGHVYNGRTTADHLRKKYRQRLDSIQTARDFIEKIASVSSSSGRAYFALPGDGRAYPTGGILTHELDRLEAWLEHRRMD